MPEKNFQKKPGARRVPQGFTVHSSGLASEFARELGWGINEEERTKTAKQKQEDDGGRDNEYGPQDAGDTADEAGSAQSGGREEKCETKPAEKVRRVDTGNRE